MPERRIEPRIPTTGSIRISFDDPGPTVVEAELIETSASGFRAVHDSKDLGAGMDVDYRRAGGGGGGGGGRARVIWTHVLNERRVSGFLIL